MPMPFESDQVLKLLRPACQWTVTSPAEGLQDRSTGVGFLSAVGLFSLAVALTAARPQKHQVPAGPMEDIGGIRVRGGDGGLWCWRPRIRCFVEQCPPVVAGILGVGGAVTFAALLTLLQWKRLTDETWTNPRPPGAGDM